MEVLLEEDKHWWFASRTRAIFALLDPLVLNSTNRVLDVGCGAGNMFHHLARYGEVWGLDNNIKPLKVARERGYIVPLGMAEAMPFPDAQFEIITLLDVIEHCDDDRAVLAECYRVCRPEGFLVITAPAFQWLWSYNDELNRHRRRYSAGSLRQLLEEAGFQIRRLTYGYFFIFPLAASLILIRERLHLHPRLASPHFDEEAYQVEMEPAPPALNALLTVIGRIEATLLRWVNLPFGTSIMAIAQKPG
ncbi:MAG TPA: class I SAM-dependent methyltransferase [Chloroflexi bacterium]|nr:class I SAM-dependent methyltransferase [Chloroflexota bacterium]